MVNGLSDVKIVLSKPGMPHLTSPHEVLVSLQDPMTLPTNSERVYLLGIWWVQFTNKACVTISVFRSAPDRWVMVDNWTERDGHKFAREGTELLGSAELATKYVNARIDEFEGNMNVTKALRLEIESDAEDIYQRVHDVFVGLGVGSTISSGDDPPTPA